MVLWDWNFVDYGFGMAQNYDLRFDSFLNLTEYFVNQNSDLP